MKPIILSLGAVFVVGLSGLWIVTSKQPATFSLQAPTTLTVGQTVAIPLMLSTKTAANAAECYLRFPNQILSLEAVEKENSVFTLWVKDSPSWSNEEGYVSLAGGRPTPGFVGDNHRIATLIFKAKKDGVAELQLDRNRSRLLANDGQGSTIKFDYRLVRVNIRPVR